MPEISPKKVLIGIPIRDPNGLPHEKVMKNLDELRTNTKHAVTLFYARGQQITQNSLTICNKVLDEGWDYLLYTGDDMIFPPWALDRLLSHNLDFVGGLFTWKSPPYKPCAAMEDEHGLPKHVIVTEDDVNNNRLIHCTGGMGSGLILVKRRVFESIKEYLENEVYPAIPKEYRWLAPMPFFPVTRDPDTNQVFSSDFAFAKLAMQCGYDIYMDCGLVVRHRWEGEYDITDHWRWMRKYGETRTEEQYFGHNPGHTPIEEKDYYWGPMGPPTMVTATSAGNEYHLQEHIAPILGCRTEPIIAEGKPVTDVGYLIGFHVGDDQAWEIYTAWCKRFKKVIIHWVGSDILNTGKWATSHERVAHMNGPRFIHVIEDERLRDELGEVIDPRNINVLPLPTRYTFPLAPLPDKFRVAVYYPKHRHEFHYGDVLRGVIEAMPDVEFNLYHLLGEKPDFEYPNLNWLGALSAQDYGAVLANSSCMLRLSQHDGRPYSIVEAAMMGRRFVTNFDMEGTHRVPDVPTVSDVVSELRQIEKERKPDEETAEIYRKINDHQTFKKAIRVLAGIDPRPRKPYEYTEYWDSRYDGGERGAGGPEPGGREAAWVNERIRKVIAETNAESVLDIGCGSMARWDKLPVSRYTGVDVSEKAVQLAAQKFPDEGDFYVADVTNDTLIRADVVTAIDVLPHIKPEHFDVAVRKIFNCAAKAVVLKVAFGVDDGYYQHSVPPVDDWSIPGNGIWTRKALTIPDNEVAKLWVFIKKEVPVGRS